MNAIFDNPPSSSQNPLLSTGEFFKYCKPRFKWIVTRRSFTQWLESRIENETIKAAYHRDGVFYFSTHQVWQIDRLANEALGPERSTVRDEFEKLLRFLTSIQDFYLPEIRSNQRFGQHYDYRGKVAVGGTHFKSETQYLLSELRKYRHQCLAQGYFEPSQALSVVGLDVAALKRWINCLAAQANSIDPIADWRPLVKYFRYSKRQKLKYEALLAQDFHEIVELLNLFINDLESETARDDLAENWSEITSYNHLSNTPQWKIERYGESLSRPYEMLEFLSNEYDLNPKPRAVVLTEGEEWKAIAKLYTY